MPDFLMHPLIENNREAIARLCRLHGVRSLEAFGSILRDDFDPGRSDVDVLVEFEAQAVALEKFRNDEWRAVLLTYIVNGKNVGMIQGRHRTRFLFKAPQPVGVARKRFWEDFQCDFATQPAIACAINLAHPARAQRR